MSCWFRCISTYTNLLKRFLQPMVLIWNVVIFFYVSPSDRIRILFIPCSYRCRIQIWYGLWRGEGGRSWSLRYYSAFLLIPRNIFLILQSTQICTSSFFHTYFVLWILRNLLVLKRLNPCLNFEHRNFNRKVSSRALSKASIILECTTFP